MPLGQDNVKRHHRYPRRQEVFVPSPPESREFRRDGSNTAEGGFP
jgi:hypothetical protein